MKPELLSKLRMARALTDTHFILTSAFRCEAHNKAVEGRTNSPHLGGWAVDIRTASSRERYEIISVLLEAGFNRIGVDNSFVHADCDPGKPANVIWTY